VGLDGARVLLVGAGGLGCPIAEVLVRAGLGALTIVDPDRVDVSNLHRQVLYGEADVGQPKVDIMVRALRRCAVGTVELLGVCDGWGVENALALSASHDLLIDGTDSYGSKFLLADVAFLTRKPAIIAACVGWGGTTFASLAGRVAGAPCYRCLFEEPPRDAAPTCATAGIVGPVAGVVGALAAHQALVARREESCAGLARSPLMTFDGRTERMRSLGFARRADCPLCGMRPRLRTLDHGRYRETSCR
jgi:adenylyltransferase/sulfurtransferase